MASNMSGALSVLVILFIQTWTNSEGQSIDELIRASMESSHMADFIQDNNNVLVELDMRFKSADWMRIANRRVPFDDDEGIDDGEDWEEVRRRRRRREVDEKERTKRNAIRQLSKRWSNKVMPYALAPGTFNTEQMNQINAAIADYNRYTCLHVKRRTNERNYVRLQNGGGCSSYVGMIGNAQPVSLAYGCRRKGIIMHELGHAAGFHHEQTRPDRDRYVRILSQNIPQSVLYNFRKYTTSEINTYSVVYDYTSMMHYGSKAFSTNGRLTIQTVDPSKQHLIGQINGFSFRDIKLLNLMYSCGARCGSKTCPGEGYVGKDCKCYCPGNPVKECSGGGGTGGGGTGGGGGEDCKDKNTNCNHWAANGECSKNKPYMHNNCRRACKLCGGTGTGTGGGGTGSNCKDENRFCPAWAARGECQRNPRYMLVRCKKSCRRCTSTGSGTCTDSNQHCGHWARNGECQKNPAYMHVNCKKSCGKC